jgi:hypothetical protein
LKGTLLIEYRHTTASAFEELNHILLFRNILSLLALAMLVSFLLETWLFLAKRRSNLMLSYAHDVEVLTEEHFSK